LEAVKQIDQRIDYVLVRGDFVVERTFLADQPVNGLYPSDHFGVVTDLAFPAT
jgi:endonuclease/exonuclease/phosphatase family metal-dependent hydrolase